MNFAEFLKEKRTQKGLTLRKMAELIDIAPAYLSDIEKRKRNAPSQDVLERLVEILELSDEEKNEMYDLAAMDKDTIAPDITEYVSTNNTIRVALRKAKDLDLGEKEWMKIIEEMENKK